MNIPSSLKLAAGGAVLFALGAGLTMLVTGRNIPLPAISEKGRVEQIVHDYLLAHPEILADMSNRLEVQQQEAVSKAQDSALKSIGTAALLDPKVAYVAGPANAKVTVAEFFDYRCPHCKASLAAMQHLAAGKNIRIAFVERPILTPDSLVAAEAAVAARRQGDKYVPFHFALMATAGELPKDRILDIAKSVGLDTARLEKDMADPAVLDSIKASNGLADRLHFDGTPTFVVNDKIIVGELTDAQLQQLADAAAKS
ncbi:MAG: thioredoxin domain-containing protein [Alphaproteobacteria bacterium]|nr:thioredoxin domain-containing protein [Alphaproteobacteria bacterium]